MWTDIHWIETPTSGRLGTMARPRGGDWLSDEIAALKRRSVDVLVSALRDDELLELDLTCEANLCQGAGLTFTSFPIEDRGLPTSAPDLLALAGQLAEHLEQGRAVVIHCRQGIGRASMLAVATLAAAGVPAERAWQDVAEARGREVPDTVEQREWVDDLFR